MFAYYTGPAREVAALYVDDIKKSKTGVWLAYNTGKLERIERQEGNKD